MTSPTRAMRGLRFCASALNVVDGDVVDAHERGVRVEHVEHVADQPEVRRPPELERCATRRVRVPQVVVAERVDLRRDQHRQRRVAAERAACPAEERERVALPAEHVGAQLDAPRRLIQRVRVELPLGVDVDRARSAAAALRRELAAVDERFGDRRRRVAVGVVNRRRRRRSARARCSTRTPTRPIQRFDSRLTTLSSRPW